MTILSPIPSYPSASRQQGITLVEILVALVLGLIIVGGVMTLLVNSRASFSTSQNQAHMLDGGRFALHAIGRDLKLAGSFGPMNWSQEITGGSEALLGTALNDCDKMFYVEVSKKVFGSNQSNPFKANTCLDSKSYKKGTDILVVRYAIPTAVDDAALIPRVTYVQSFLSRGQLFVAGSGVIPTIFPDNNHRLVTHVYYINKDTEDGDGLPSLHRISLVAGTDGPEMRDEILVSGVENMQVQFGINDCDSQSCPRTINRYVDASNPIFGGKDWPDLSASFKIQAVRVWVLVRSESIENGLDTSGTFSMGSEKVVIKPESNDSYRRAVYSGVYKLRNAGERGRQL